MAEMNRVYNCKNPFQGKAKKVLCVCSAGLLRSPTAANVLHREFGHNTRACGITTDYALIPADDVLFLWADEIVVMESWMAHQIKDGFQNKIVCLNIPDNFGFMDDELQKMILHSYLHNTQK